MAMYYQGSSSEIQAADGLHHTLYLLNPNYVAYSDTPQQPTTHFLNSASVLPHAPPSPLPQFTGIPLSHYNIYNSLVDQTTNQNQPLPRGLSLSLAAHDQSGFDTCGDPIDQLGQSSIAIISPKNCSSPSLTTTESNGADATRISAVVGSKYLKAAQELLDDVANVGKDVKRENKAKTIKDSVVAAKITNTEGENGGGHELTTAQRQEIQMKKAKLNSMLDEVEQRCRQYHHQMQIVVASFEQAAGPGSAKSYTQLALKTILKQFRCLKSTISAQIKALSKSLGEEETTDKKFEGSRLKFVDHQLRQHRALQQLGMVQNNNAWRPQRGLPERAVSVLRAWLFEHFLHPYPKDSDKQMLAKQTGLTRSQVSNWFINARVRLWKPMVEEMYLEEIKSNNQELISSDNNSTKNGQQNQNHNKTAKIDPSPTDISPSTVVSASPTGSRFQSRAGFAQLITSLNLPENSPKKPRTHDSSPSSILSAEMEMKGAGERSKGLNNYLSSMNRYGVGEFSPGQHQQQLAATGSFPGNSFSLSLALPPTETSQGAHQQNFLSHQFGMRIESGNVESTSHPSIGYEILDFQNRKPFPAQLLPDFVA